MPQGASLLNVLQLLETGRVKPHLLVLPEGFTLRDLARQIEAEGIAPAADVIRIATSPHLAWSLGIETDSLEGYLFPDTYQVTKGMRVEEILGRMTQRFRDRVGTPEVVARARERGLTLHQLITLASIVEKAAALASERPIIARVFLNRLRLDMPLQADPTVAYAMAKEGRSPTRRTSRLTTPTIPTRTAACRPPIGNPGRSTIDAVLGRPTPYFYRRHHDRSQYFSTILGSTTGRSRGAGISPAARDFDACARRWADAEGTRPVHEPTDARPMTVRLTSPAAEQPERFPAVYAGLKRVIPPVLRRFFAFRVSGLEHLPERGPYIIAANHANYLDGVLLAMALPRKISFLVMPRVYRATPLHPYFHDHVGSIPVSLARPDPGAIRRAIRVLAGRRGHFRGPFSRHGRLAVVNLAWRHRLRSGVSFVPAAIEGTFMHRSPALLRPAPVPLRRALQDAAHFATPWQRATQGVRADVTGRIMEEIAALLATGGSPVSAGIPR